MNRRDTFDDALNAALDELRSGQAIEDVLAAHPRHAPVLASLLDTASDVFESAERAPSPSPRLQANFSRVRAALRDARVAEGRAGDANGGLWSWFGRRWQLASLSLPAAGVLLAVVAGTGGAAAATVAIVAPDLPAKVASAVAPQWVENIAHNAGIGDGGDEADGTNAGGGDAGGEGDIDGPAVDATWPPMRGATPPARETAQAIITLSGTIEVVQGSTFVLVDGDATWRVQTDANTAVSGAIVAGANATVSGRASGGNTVKAEEVTTDAAEDPGALPPGQQPAPPGQGSEPPGQQQAPPGQGEEPSGQPNIPPAGSGAPEAPPGQSMTPPAPSQSNGPPDHADPQGGNKNDDGD